MPNLTISVPDDFYQELTNISQELKQKPEQTMLLALSHFMQTGTLGNAIEGLHRIQDGQALVDFPELEEELGLNMKFHPQAMEELEAFEEEDQIEVLEEIINRISASEIEIEDTMDLVIQEEGETQVVLSGFDFGDVVYQNGPHLAIYHIAIEEDDDEEDEDEEIEMEMEN